MRNILKLVLVTLLQRNAFGKGIYLMKQYFDKNLIQLITELNENIPSSVLGNQFENIDLLRATVLRESIFLRIKELAESIFDNCLKDRFVSSVILLRALMETEAFFVRFLSKLEQAIKNKKFNEIQEFLTNALRGTRSKVAKVAKEKFDRPTSTNILTAIDNMNAKIPFYRDQYDFLSEFSHPNSAGLNKKYCRLDRETGTALFGDHREKVDINFIQNQRDI